MKQSELTNEEFQIQIIKRSIQKYRKILAEDDLCEFGENTYLKLLEEEENKLLIMEDKFPEYFL